MAKKLLITVKERMYRENDKIELVTMPEVQCALVEYDQGRSDIPSKLFHDAWLRRSRVIQGKRKFAKEPGVAQTVHWARTMKQVMLLSFLLHNCTSGSCSKIHG